MMVKENLKKIISRALKAGVKYFHTISVNIENLDNILSITKEYENIFASVGVHPNEVQKILTPEEIVKLTQHSKIISIGETGLDYKHPNVSDIIKNNQKKSFESHIIASQISKIPLVIHSRNAEKDSMEIFLHHKQNQDFDAVMHCFTGSKNFAKFVLDKGFYISFSGIITFKNAHELRNIVKYVPLERILYETDAPYLAPEPFRGKINEPAYCKYTLKTISNLLEKKESEVEKITFDNFFRLFKKAFKSKKLSSYK